MPGEDNGKASQKWSDLFARRAAPGREGWFFAIDNPRLRQRVQDTYMGGLDPFSWLRAELGWRHTAECQPIPRALEIGCGAGDIAIGLMQAGWFEALDAFDVAEGAIASAQARFAAAGLDGLRFFVEDANTMMLEPASYDFIYANHALHHVTDLEHLFTQCAAALRPGGVMFASDYVGPSRMQYSGAHLALMNDMLARVPPEKRHDSLQGFRVKRLIERTPLQAFLDEDPSEAPRSAEIIPVLGRFFDVQVQHYGMELSYEVLLGIVHSFDPDDPADNALMDSFFELDQAAARSGQAAPLFANLIARPRDRAAVQVQAVAPPVALRAQDQPASPPQARDLQAPDLQAVAQSGAWDFAALLQACAVPPPGLGAVAAIEGWLAPEAADLTARLCRLQAGLGLRTGVLEFGVYRGKYLAHLASLHADAELPLVGVDLFIERIGRPIAPEHVAHFAALIAANVAGAAPGAAPPVILSVNTADLDAPSLLRHCPAGYSFVSVDAGHEADDVARDLALAASVLSPGGIVALDDAFFPGLPGVAEGLFRHLAAEGAMTAFAFCANKLFLCRPDMHRTYLAYARWLLGSGHEAEYLAGAAAQDRANQGVLFTPRLAGREIVAFAPRTVPA